MDEESGRELYWWMHDLALGTICRGSEGAPVEALSMVPETVAVAGSIVRPRGPAESRLQPICPPGGHPMLCFVRVDGEPALPATLRADRIVVVHGDEVWVGPLVEEDPETRGSARFQVTARHGPKWEPGLAVDVVVQLRDAMRKLYFVRAPGQVIERSA